MRYCAGCVLYIVDYLSVSVLCAFFSYDCQPFPPVNSSQLQQRHCGAPSRLWLVLPLVLLIIDRPRLFLLDIWYENIVSLLLILVPSVTYRIPEPLGR